MSNLKKLLKERKKYLIIGGILVIVISYFIFGGGGKKQELYEVKRADIEQSVILSGKVETSDRADLGFAASGRLGNIFVKNTQKVFQGQILAQLEIGDLLADLKIKKANSQTSNIDLESAKEEVEKVTKQEDAKVENAYRTMLSEDLELVPNSASYNIDPPVVSGLYSGTEGQYKISIKDEDSNSSDLTLLTFNLEKTERLIKEKGSTPLGTKGLYVSFGSEDVLNYEDTIWTLEIPNKAGVSYLTNYNAYVDAKNHRDLAIKNAEFDYQKLLAEDDGGASVAEAEIQKINAEIRKNTIYAPFGGIVTNIEKEVGENASVGERIISILGEDKLEVVLQVSELDVSRLISGTSIKITLDAFKGEDFYGVLKTINSRETEIDGVPVYEAFVELSADPRIKTGMSAIGTVIIDSKKDVVVIPSYLVKKVGDFNMAQVLDEDGNTIDKEVTLGLLGTDNMIEVVSGLEVGETVVSTSK